MDRSYRAIFSFGDLLNNGLSTMTRDNIGVMAKRTGSSVGQDEREERSPEGMPPHLGNNLERVRVGDIADAGNRDERFRSEKSRTGVVQSLGRHKNYPSLYYLV